MTACTTDTFFNGRIQLKQERSGYRYSIDAVLLAGYAGKFVCDSLLDLGAGCGIIPMILAYRHPDLRIYGVEVQSALAQLATENVRANRMAERVTIYHADMKLLHTDMTGGPVDHVVANPPFYRINTGRINPNSQRALARHEIAARIGDVAVAAKRMLRTGGRFTIVYTAERLCDLMREMRDAGIEPKEMQPIQSTGTDDAKLVLVTGLKGAKPGLKLLAPLILYDASGAYTPSAARMFEASGSCP